MRLREIRNSALDTHKQVEESENEMAVRYFPYDCSISLFRPLAWHNSQGLSDLSKFLADDCVGAAPRGRNPKIQKSWALVTNGFAASCILANSILLVVASSVRSQCKRLPLTDVGLFKAQSNRNS